MAVDLLGDSLNKIKLCDRIGKMECEVKASKLLESILALLKSNGFVSDYSRKENGKGGLLVIKLNGKINELKVVKPRFPVSSKKWVDTESQFLPAYNLGMLIVSTPKGIMNNKDAKEAKIGGRLIAFVY
jgi:small subunit ribosomal protein S8